MKAEFSIPMNSTVLMDGREDEEKEEKILIIFKVAVLKLKFKG
jgi:hypothetical protein